MLWAVDVCSQQLSLKTQRVKITNQSNNFSLRHFSPDWLEVRVQLFFSVCLFVCLFPAVIYWCGKGNRPAFTQDFLGHSEEESHLLGTWMGWTLLTGASSRQKMSQP